MKARFLIFLCISFSLSAFGQNRKISGTYYDEGGAIIEISGNEFNYIVEQFENPCRCTDTLAICTFKWADADFIELNSTPPHILALKGFKADKFTDAAINDSIKVSFLFPRENRNLKITVIDNDSFNSFHFIYSDSNRELMLPENVASIDLYIEPEQIDNPCYGIARLELFHEFQIEKDINHISIEAPAIDCVFFDRYYVKDEYAKISKNTITWKGKVFKKSFFKR